MNGLFTFNKDWGTREIWPNCMFIPLLSFSSWLFEISEVSCLKWTLKSSRVAFSLAEIFNPTVLIRAHHHSDHYPFCQRMITHKDHMVVITAFSESTEQNSFHTEPEYHEKKKKNTFMLKGVNSCRKKRSKCTKSPKWNIVVKRHIFFCVRC